MGREVASKILDGINDLVIMAPIREGFIEAYEPVTYATRLRIISEALNDIRAAAREYENESPFADASERILSLLDFKAGIIDNQLLQLDPELGLSSRRYFYLIATFDGVWEPYMRLIWHPLGSLLDLLFCNCEGYVFARDNSFEDYMNWIRTAQVDSAVFFTTTGVTVSDQIYLRKLERLQRETDPATADLAISRMAMQNPGVAADRFARANPFNTAVANRLALEALGVFYRLSDYYPPLPQFVVDGLKGNQRADGILLQRAVHTILEGWDRNNPQLLAGLAPGGLLERFAPLVAWFDSGVNEAAMPAFRSQKPPVEDPKLDESEVQRGILKHCGAKGERVHYGATVLLTVSDPGRAPGFIEQLLADDAISFEGAPSEPADGIYCTLGLTKNGLKRLSLKVSTLDAFPKEFREGMHVRSPHFGDVWSNHPRSWPLPERNWPPLQPGERRPPVEMEEVDLVLVVRLAGPKGATIEDTALRAKVESLIAMAESYGVLAQSIDLLENHYDEAGLLRDHFDYVDGLSQPKPVPAAEPDFKKRTGEKRDQVRLGEVLCGYATDRQDEAPAPTEDDVLRIGENTRLNAGKRDRKEARKHQLNGSYLVLRKMRQDVASFKKVTAETAAKYRIDSDLVAAKLLGRYPDGRALADPAAVNQNDFDYVKDAEGSGCPFAAHVRRANPRAVEHGRPSPRLVRCGMSYGERYDPGVPDSAAKPRGLMFMAFNSSIAEQYETIQRWLNGGNSTGIASADNDPLTGIQPRIENNLDPQAVARGPSGKPEHPYVKRTHRFEVDGKVVRAEIAKPFVELEWGLYLFVPSRTTLQFLAKPGRLYYELGEPYEEAGLAYIARIEQLPEDLQAAEWKRITEDFDSKDISQRDITPDVFAGIRYGRDGAVEVKGGIDKMHGALPDAQEDGKSKAERPPVVVVGSRDKIFDVLRDYEHYSVENALARLVDTSGSIYVAQQPPKDPKDTKPESVYSDPELIEKLRRDTNYYIESEGTNGIIHEYGAELGFEHGYEAGKAVLAWLKADAQKRFDALAPRQLTESVKPEFKLELRREYISPALAMCNRIWFGLPDGGFKEEGKDGPVARFMASGAWDWTPARVKDASDPNWSWDTDPARLPTCPGDNLTPARHAFQPRSNQVSALLAKNHGNSIYEAGQAFANHYFGAGGKENVPGLISNRLFNLPGMDAELAGRNVIGIMLGTTPPMMANLQGIFYDWLNERTLWRHQTALARAAGGKPATYEAAMASIHRPLSVAMCKRPSPELMFRTCRATTEIKRSYPVAMGSKVKVKDTIEVKPGTTIYLPLASASQWQVCQSAKDPAELDKGVDVIFGGRRGEPDAPIHACPGRKLAMGAMLGIAAAFLEAGRIQAQPAGLIVRISDWT